MFSPVTKSDKKESALVSQRILGFCFAVFLGALLLSLAVDILASIWGWLLLAAGIITVLWIASLLYRRWRNRW